MTPDLAQTLAVKALAWMVGEDDLREVFLGASGASESDLRAGVSDPVFFWPHCLILSVWMTPGSRDFVMMWALPITWIP